MQVQTENSTYEVDLKAMTVARILTERSRKMRRDDDVLKLTALDRPIVGKRWLSVIDVREDGILTVRETSPVTEVTGMEEYDEWISSLTRE